MRTPRQYLRDRRLDRLRDDMRTVGVGQGLQLVDVGQSGGTGAHPVRRYGAMMSSDFLACETVKVRAIRQLPVHVMLKGEHGPERQAYHDLAKAFERPNALMSWGDLIAWAILRRDCMGTAYVKVYADPMTGYVRELRPVLGTVQTSYDRTTGVAVYSSPGDRLNPPWECREDLVVVMKTDISDDGGVTGESLAEKAAADIGLSVDLAEFYRSLMENGNHMQGWLETEGKLRPEDLAAVRESVKATSGPENAGTIRIFDRGLKYHDVQAQLDGMSIVEQERFVLEKICRACHVDMHHVYADDGASSTTATGADIDFVKHTVLPEVTAIERAFQPVLDGARSMGGSVSNYYVKFNVEGLLRGDLSTRVEAYRTLVYAGIRTRKDVCETEDWPWYPGQEKLLQPTAYYEVGEDGEPYVPAEPTQGTSGQSDGISGIDPKEAGGALAPLLRDAMERARLRVARDGATDKSRQFAHTCIDPVAQAAAQVGVLWDVDALVNQVMDGGSHEE